MYCVCLFNILNEHNKSTNHKNSFFFELISHYYFNISCC